MFADAGRDGESLVNVHRSPTVVIEADVRDHGDGNRRAHGTSDGAAIISEDETDS